MEVVGLELHGQVCERPSVEYSSDVLRRPLTLLESRYDNCYIPYDNISTSNKSSVRCSSVLMRLSAMENEYGRYKRMADAIDQLAAKYNEKPFIYSLCQWGWENP